MAQGRSSAPPQAGPGEANPFDRSGIEDSEGDPACPLGTVDRSKGSARAIFLPQHCDLPGRSSDRLPRSVRAPAARAPTLYFSAFQSHLWNLILARWIEHSTDPSQRVAVELKTGRYPFPRQLRQRASPGFPRNSHPVAVFPNGLPAEPARNSDSRGAVRISVAVVQPQGQASEGRVLFQGLEGMPGFPGEARALDDRRRASSRSSGNENVVRAVKGLIRHHHGQADHGHRGWVAMNLEVLFEDNHCLAVNKPAGLLARGTRRATRVLSSWRLTISGPGTKSRATSTWGYCIGSTDRLRGSSSGQDEQGRRPVVGTVSSGLDREALLGDCGRTRSCAGRGMGRLARKGHPANRSGVAVDDHPSSKEARVAVRVVGQWGRFTKLELRPATGRSHQLRVQLAGRGLPILGDVKYGAKSRLNAARRTLQDRMHAAAIDVHAPDSA